MKSLLWGSVVEQLSAHKASRGNPERRQDQPATRSEPIPSGAGRGERGNPRGPFGGGQLTTNPQGGDPPPNDYAKALAELRRVIAQAKRDGLRTELLDKRELELIRAMAHQQAAARATGFSRANHLLREQKARQAAMGPVVDWQSDW
jgi:hypothetical protein